MIDLLIAAGIPSAITAFLFWLLKRNIDRNENKREEKENNTEKLILMLVNTSHSTNILAEATAKAVQRIPQAHCNGDMTAALEQAAKYQKEEQEFITQQGIKNILEKD